MTFLFLFLLQAKTSNYSATLKKVFPNLKQIDSDIIAWEWLNIPVMLRQLSLEGFFFSWRRHVLASSCEQIILTFVLRSVTLCYLLSNECTCSPVYPESCRCQFSKVRVGLGACRGLAKKISRSLNWPGCRTGSIHFLWDFLSCTTIGSECLLSLLKWGTVAVEVYFCAIKSERLQLAGPDGHGFGPARDFRAMIWWASSRLPLSPKGKLHVQRRRVAPPEMYYANWGLRRYIRQLLRLASQTLFLSFSSSASIVLCFIHYCSLHVCSLSMGMQSWCTRATRW
jgi:hypothetical protein